MKTVSIDGSAVRSSEQLHEVLMKEFGFPDFYGRNWNAFWDAITGLVEMPDKITIYGWQVLKNTLSQDAQMLLSCLNDYNQEADLKRVEIILE